MHSLGDSVPADLRHTLASFWKYGLSSGGCVDMLRTALHRLIFVELGGELFNLDAARRSSRLKTNEQLALTMKSEHAGVCLHCSIHAHTTERGTCAISLIDSVHLLLPGVSVRFISTVALSARTESGVSLQGSGAAQSAPHRRTCRLGFC
jgi:hypothetical protein